MGWGLQGLDSLISINYSPHMIQSQRKEEKGKSLQGAGKGMVAAEGWQCQPGSSQRSWAGLSREVSMARSNRPGWME